MSSGKNSLAAQLNRASLWVVLGAVSLAVIVPLVYLFMSSLKSTIVFHDGLFLPRGDGFLGVNWGGLTLGNFKRLFSPDVGIGRGLLNSLFLSSVTALGATLLCAAAGYALARLRFAGRKAFDWFVVGALVIPPPLLIAPGYQWLYDLGLLDTFAGVILPALAPAFGVYLFRQAAVQSVPASLIEAARIDGAGEVAIFFRVAMPLMRPMIGAFLIITFLAMWNNFIGPQIVLQSPDKQPLSVLIFQTKTAYSTDYGLLMAGTVFSILPVMLLFLLLQREFISGLTAGAVKQ